MTAYPWRAALTRWGDTLFKLALLLTDDRTAAERATIQAFTRSFATPSEDPETALYAALLRMKPGRRNPFRRRSLPRVLDRIAPPDRVLLGALLLRDIDGLRLLAVAGQTADVVLARLEAALLPLLDPQDPARTGSAARQAFSSWLRRRLGLAPTSTVEEIAYDPAQIKEWQAAADDLRHALREAVERQHLPTTCVELIETTMLEPPDDEAPRWWQKRAAWIGALAIVLCLVWIVKPWQQGLGEATGAARTSKELVQETLDAWTTMPVTGTLHRQVITNETRFRYRPMTTDVWLDADSAQHRIEARVGQALVEWQIGDGASRFMYAANPRYSSCGWAVNAQVLDQSARRFTLPAEQQAKARDSRLMSGGYGQGYLALKAALSAPDLRSFGTRVEGKTTLLVLGYTDRRTTPERKLLLWIDPARHMLHAVREVAEAGGQADARDLWRLKLNEELETGISAVPPSWPGSTLTPDRLLDPRCPGLDTEHIISLRSFISNQWWGSQRWYVPSKLPADVTYAAMLTPTSVAENAIDGSFVSAIFVSPDRWVSMRLDPRDVSPAEGIERGNWRVALEERGESLEGNVCRRFNDARTGFCIPSIAIIAQGWSRDDLLALIDTLKPTDGQTWQQYDDLFLDPQPIDPQTKAILQRSLAAIDQLKQQPLYSITEHSVRTPLDRPVWQDPYHVPLDLIQPEHAIQEQWIVYSDTQVLRYRELTRHPRGDLLIAQVRDDQHFSMYNVFGGALWTSHNRNDLMYAPPGRWNGEDLLLSLVGSRQPITVTEQSGSWLLEQPIDMQFESSWSDPRFIDSLGSIASVWNLQPQTFYRRVWIDQATMLPYQGALIHRDNQNQETEIRAATISVQPQQKPFPDTMFTMPDLPRGTLVFENNLSSNTGISEASFKIALPPRVLAWNTSGIEVVKELGSFNPAVFAASPQLGMAQRALYASSRDLDGTGLIQSTSYRLPQSETTITLRQGPRDLLYHILRYQTGLAEGREQTWRSSKPLSIWIAGEPRTVWLLETTSQALLVFEIDDLLVHIAGPNTAMLEQTVFPALSKLEWAAPSTSR